MNNKQILQQGAEELGLSLKDHQVEQLLKYKNILLEWNEKINLTAIRDEQEIMIKHFLDSLSCTTIPYLKENAKVIDVGTGAGFPGIPILIYYPHILLTLLDSLNKRIHFLKEVCSSIGLSNIRFEHGRAEDYGKDHLFREQYDIAVARAVAELNVLCEYCLPFVKVGGYFICQKGPNIEEEMQRSKKAIEQLGGKCIEIKKIKLPFLNIVHSIMIIEKTRQTPTKFPRRAGIPNKKPL